MFEARIHFRLEYIYFIYIYKVLKPLLVQWMDILMYPYCIPTREVCWLANSGQQIGTKTYHNNMFEARIHFRLENISFLYIYKVLKPLPVQWMDIWMYPYCIPTSEVVWLANSGQLMGTKHHTKTWLRTGSTSDWITFLFHICIKFLIPFQCNGWTYGCILTVSQPGRLADWLILDNK